MIRASAFAALAAAGLLATATGAGGQERPWSPLPSPASLTCTEGLCQADALTPFFRALDFSGTVRIVQFGDSHTAGRLITGALESRLQDRFPETDLSVAPIGAVGATLNDLPGQGLPMLDAPVDLVIIAYGANEGFDDRLDPVSYEALLRDQIARLRREAPGAALLILGAPEAMRGDGGGVCPDDPERRWSSPAMLAVVRDVQRRVAADSGVAFWDWRGRMGGACSAHRLTLDGPWGPDPLMRGDHVHFTAAGADWVGSLLFADLMAAEARWRRRGGR